MGDSVIIGDCSPRVSRIDLATGEAAWSTRLPSEGQIHADAVVSDREVLIGIDAANPGALISLDPQTGAVRSSIPIAHGISQIVSAEPLLIVVRGDGSLTGLDPTGASEGWNRRRLPGPVGEQPLAAMIDESIYWSSSARTLERIDPLTGIREDSIELDSAISSAPAGSDGRIVIGRRGAIEILDASLKPLRSVAIDGRPVWVHLRGNGLVALIESEARLMLVDHRLSGDLAEELGRTWFEDTQLSTPRPVIANDRLVFGTEQGELITLGLDGSASAVLELGAIPRGLTLHGDQLLVGTREGRLVSVRLSEDSSARY